MLFTKYFPVLLTFFICRTISAQTDVVGSGGAIRFDGVDDYISFGDVYSDLKIPFTISSWVYLDPSNTLPAPIFSNRNCDPIYTGFRLIVNNNIISMDYGDGLGGNSPSFRRGKNAAVGLLTGNWNHITAVVKGNSDMDLYLNGVNVGGTYMGNSSLTMDSSKPGFASSAYFISNGVVYRLNGIIDDIRLWNRALSESDIRDTMCKNLTGLEPGLIGYWNFNETTGNIVYDHSSNHFNGIFSGTPIRVKSGAPIGDISTYLYTDNWTNEAISLINDDQILTVKNISNTSAGIQLYSVNHPPNYTSGLEGQAEKGSYFGVFLAHQHAANTFTADLVQNNGMACRTFSRNDNSISSWTAISLPLVGKQQRTELIQSQEIVAPFQLGADTSLCGASQYKISTNITDPQYSFLWSNDQTTSSIIVNTSGEYSVTVTGACGVIRDAINVLFLTPPMPFSFGEDIVTCEVQTPVKLYVPECTGCTVQWQDGSAKNEFYVADFGTYWSILKNRCGQATDTITFSASNEPVFIPNVITPNGDEKNEIFMIPENLVGSVSVDVYNRWGGEVYHASPYNNDWSGSDLSSGVYFMVLNGPCLNFRKNILTIIK